MMNSFLLWLTSVMDVRDGHSLPAELKNYDLG